MDSSMSIVMIYEIEHINDIKRNHLIGIRKSLKQMEHVCLKENNDVRI